MTTHRLNEVAAFLNGEAPMDGLWFDEHPLDGRSRYWWRAALNEALANQSPAPAQPVWQLIETAPKDGSLFLCWVASVRYDEDPETGEFREVDVSEPDFGRWAGSEDDGYYEPMSGLPGDHGAPTHWMPLPAAPIQAPVTGEQP
ncbi:MAG TPA: hypothetical protein VIN03_11855 [Roseateles sp.]